MALRPLDGFTVGITADRRWEEQAELFTRRGASVIHGPVLATAFLGEHDILLERTRTLIAEPPDAVVVNTGTGMRAWFEAAETWGILADLLVALGGSTLLARGPKAEAACTRLGLRVASRARSERLSEVLVGLQGSGLRGKRIAVQLHGEAQLPFCDALRTGGATVIELPVYCWHLPDDRAPALRLAAAVVNGGVDAVTFTSAPAVENLLAMADISGIGHEVRAGLNGPVVAAYVGPVCAEAARALGLRTPVAPGQGRLGLVVRAVIERLGERRRCLRLRGLDVTVQGSALDVDGVVATLAPKERAILDALIDRQGAVVSRGQLLRCVWGQSGGDERALEVAVGRLRRRMGPVGIALQAVPRRGYMLEV